MNEIKVSQQAREAAAERFDAAFGPTELTREMRLGLHDCDPMVQAFARFEQAIRADERERAADAIPALEALANKLTDQYDEPFSGPDSQRLHYWRDKAITVAKALRDMSASTSMPTTVAGADGGAEGYCGPHWRRHQRPGDDGADGRVQELNKISGAQP